jgi:hypothetical protein
MVVSVIVSRVRVLSLPGAEGLIVKIVCHAGLPVVRLMSDHGIALRGRYSE